MGFSYNDLHKKSESGEHTNWWTSYADLFMMLSVVFLLMYVSASLRSGAAGFQKQQQFEKIAKENADLKEQINVYNTLKDQQLAGKSEEEQAVYARLMDKLKLLKEEANEEKESLMKQAKENEQKELALNQYQQIVRNIVNANMLAKVQLKRRDLTIVKNVKTINEKEQVITAQNQEIKEKETEIAQNEQKIQEINDHLARKIKQLRNEQKAAHRTRQETEKRIAKLRKQSAEQVAVLNSKSEEIENELRSTQTVLTQTKNNLTETESNLVATQGKLGRTQEQNQALAQTLEDSKQRYLAEITKQRAAHQAQLSAERETFNRNLAAQNLSAKQKADKLAQFAADAARKAGMLEGQLSGLTEKVGATEAKLAGLEKEKNQYANAVQGLQAEKGQLEAGLHGLQKEKEGLAREKGQLESGLQGLRQQNEGLAREKGQLQSGLQGLRQQNEGLAKEKGRYVAAYQGLAKENAEMQGDLAKAKALANARRDLAKSITDAFRKAGIKAAVDPQTGVATLDFGNEYFDTGRAELKPSMRHKLDQFFPIYTDSLFNNPKSADKIANVEIIGFASSTYKGKYVSPESLRPEDQEAVSYNLKLSFSRAQEIFKHVYSGGTLSTRQKKSLLPLIKVVGRGYLPEGKTGADIPVNLTEAEFCSRYNCHKAQRVIVKFNLKD